jgi:GT2 family glycosyltransferase
VLKTVHVVMVNWNLKVDTLACVRSLLAAGLPVDRIIVVDNGSTDGSVPALRQAFGDGLHVLEAQTNLGYAAGVNRGARHALARGADWVFLMNNDTVVAPTIFQAFEQAATEARGFAILAPLIFYSKDPGRIWYCADRLIPGTLMTRSLYKNRRPGAGLPRVVPADFLNGCGMLVHRAVFEAVSYLDERLFMYGEEVDFCWRARLAGFTLACVTTAQMWHQVSASANRDQPLSRYLRAQNQNRFYREYTRGWRRVLMFLLSGARLMAISLRDAASGRAELVRPGLVGWWNGWSGTLRRTWG